MNDAALKSGTQEIVVDEVFPHAPEAIWKTLTNGELMARWLRMPATGFEPVKGKKFTYQTTPGGAWDGVIHCEVLEAVPNQRLVYTWKSGHAENVGYGAALNTSLPSPSPGSKTERAFALVHSGFCSKGETASRTWATAGRRSSQPSAPSPASKTDASTGRGENKESTP